MTRYRKKSLITAWQFNPDNQKFLTEGDSWIQMGIMPADPKIEYNTTGIIYTKQGLQIVNPTDWLICNPDGEVYPCNNKTFIDTYEVVVE